MHTFLIFAVLGVITLATSGEKITVTSQEKAAFDAMIFKSRHLSIEQCDSMNYKVGREMKGNNSRESFIDAAPAGETIEKTIVDRKALNNNKTPAWVSEIRQKGEAYQAEKKQKANRNKDRLAAYSKTELSIAKNMGLNPWDIDRKLLRRWGQEADIIPSKF